MYLDGIIHKTLEAYFDAVIHDSFTHLGIAHAIAA